MHHGFSMEDSSVQKKRVIVGITGASGVIYGVKALEMLASLDNVEVHLIMSTAAKRTLHEETDWNVERVERSEEHTSELQSRGHLVCRLLLEKKKTKTMKV